MPHRQKPPARKPDIRPAFTAGVKTGWRGLFHVFVDTAAPMNHTVAASVFGGLKSLRAAGAPLATQIWRDTGYIAFDPRDDDKTLLFLNRPAATPADAHSYARVCTALSGKTAAPAHIVIIASGHIPPASPDAALGLSAAAKRHGTKIDFVICKSGPLALTPLETGFAGVLQKNTGTGQIRISLHDTADAADLARLVEKLLQDPPAPPVSSRRANRLPRFPK